MFPFSVRGKVKIKTAGVIKAATIQDELASGLISEQAAEVKRFGDGVDFQVGLFRPFGWKVLVGISTGKIVIEEMQQDYVAIAYEIYFLNLIIWTTTLIFLVLGLDLLFSTTVTPKFCFIIGWFWLTIGNVLATNFQFRRFIRQCIRDANRQLIYR